MEHALATLLCQFVENCDSGNSALEEWAEDSFLDSDEMFRVVTRALAVTRSWRTVAVIMTLLPDRAADLGLDAAHNLLDLISEQFGDRYPGQVGAVLQALCAHNGHHFRSYMWNRGRYPRAIFDMYKMWAVASNEWDVDEERLADKCAH